MLIRDVMTTNVVSIPSTTSLAEARVIMQAHHIKRLPVADKGKLTGIITRDKLDRAGPSELTTFSIHEISYLLSKITVAQIMRKEVVTIDPDATVEEAVSLAQQKKVGALVVLDGGRIVGIATTNDFFYKILNPTLGIGEPGARIVVRNCSAAGDVCKILGAVDKVGVPLVGMFTLKVPDTSKFDCTLHLDTDDPQKVISDFQRLGYTAEQLAR